MVVPLFVWWPQQETRNRHIRQIKLHTEVVQFASCSPSTVCSTANLSTVGCLRNQWPRLAKIALCLSLPVLNWLPQCAVLFSFRQRRRLLSSKPSCVGRSPSLFGPLTCSVTLAVTSSANALRESTTHQRPLQARLITCGPYHIPFQAITSRLGRLHDLTGRTSSRGLPVYVLTTPSKLLVLPQIRGPSPRPGDFVFPFAGCLLLQEPVPCQVACS